MANVNPGPATTSNPNTVAVVTPVNTQTNPGPQGLNALRLIAVARGINANATGDTIMPVINAGSYSVQQVVLTNASISLTTAAAGIFTAAAAGGTAIRANAALSALTSSTVVSAAAPATTAVQTAQNLYFNVATAQGAAATLDCFVYAYDVT